MKSSEYGKELRALRESLGMKQTEAAAAAGFNSGAYVSRLESGSVAMTQVRFVQIYLSLLLARLEGERDPSGLRRMLETLRVEISRLKEEGKI